MSKQKIRFIVIFSSYIERGKFLAVDFASKDLRLLMCELTDSGIEMKVKGYKMPEHVLFSSGERVVKVKHVTIVF